jgi:phosphoribosyl-dephospho-CoA transferase
MSLGVTLPLSRSRARLGFALGHRAIRHVAPPLRLADVLGSAPPAWREPLSGIDRAAGDMGLSVSVYGSLAWEHMTGERYLREGSDVDLLVRPRTRAQLAGTLALLQRWDGHHGLRIDGEIVLGREHAVAWREMAGGRARVLVKTGTSVGLQPLGDLLSTLGEDRA